MAMHRAAQIAFAKNTPIVLDPVGVGATAYRTDAAQGLLSTARPMVIRGNASEVAALAGDLAVETKGVDSSMGVDDAGRAARLLAEMTHGAVTVSGAIDLVVSSAGMFRIENGHPLMSRVTGMGCVASALTGAFCSVNSSPLKAAAHTMLVMGVAGELAAKKASGPGSFKTVFLDVLYNLNKEDLVDHARLQTA
jgi:hydroxyethylthiazole kinase